MPVGHYLVEEALDAGLRVIATARSLESIRDLEKRGATILELDLTADEAIINDFAQKAIAVQYVLVVQLVVALLKLTCVTVARLTYSSIMQAKEA